jgi:hypothetical protein
MLHNTIDNETVCVCAPDISRNKTLPFSKYNLQT